jgi:hypothetical protein
VWVTPLQTGANAKALALRVLADRIIDRLIHIILSKDCSLSLPLVRSEVEAEH